MIFENYTSRPANPLLNNAYWVNIVAPNSQNDANKACWQISGYTQRYIDEQIMSGTKIVSDKPFSITTSAKTEMTDQGVRRLWNDLPHREQYFDKDWNMTLTVDCKGTEYLLEGKKSILYPGDPAD